jgi:hypothetical protein|tara:strand:- start:1443 stop:1604 length:162 start_codon:yes stop_codon:yes gene_type:complete
VSKLVVIEVDEEDSQEAVIILKTIVEELQGINDSLKKLVDMIEGEVDEQERSE